MSSALGSRFDPCDVLLDAPPQGLEVEFDIEVFYRADRAFRRLGEVSPMVKALAREQFDDYVKRVRVFVSPRLATELDGRGLLPGLLEEAIEKTETD